MPTYYLIVHRGSDQKPTFVKVVDDAGQTRKYLDKVARDAGKFDITVVSRSDAEIQFADGKSVSVTEVQ